MIHVCRNSGYGSLLMSKEKHTKISYTRQSHESRLKINDPRFRTLSELDDGVYEIEMAKQRINLDLPIQLGFFILQYAKQRMLEFYLTSWMSTLAEIILLAVKWTQIRFILE